jgi:hypothetical protein
MSSSCIELSIPQRCSTFMEILPFIGIEEIANIVIDSLIARASVIARRSVWMVSLYARKFMRCRSILHLRPLFK